LAGDDEYAGAFALLKYASSVNSAGPVNTDNQVLMPLFPTARHAWWSGDTPLTAALWIINLTAVFFITHYLFEMNGRSLFFGWDGQSMLAFLGERHRFSSTLFGVGSDPIIGLGNISYALNPAWFPLLCAVDNALGRN
jgi:hypothetical protein